jgi:hypothetical protein
MTAPTPSTLRDDLSAHFAPADIEWRIGQAGKKDDGSIWAKAFAYLTNRAIQDRLDDVMGPGQWRNEEPRIVQIADGDGKAVTAFLCGLSLKIDGEWITKWDGAEPSDMEPVKGGLSGSMKRAAVQWGIGRYLYDLPEGWAKVGPQGANYASGVKVRVKGADGRMTEERVTFKWDPPDLPKWALPETGEKADQSPLAMTVTDARVSIDKLLPSLGPDVQAKVKESLEQGASPIKVLKLVREMALSS